MTQRGLLIVFEGLDRSGKSTQAKRLAEHIKHTERDVVLQPFPDRAEPVGQLIDRYLRREINLSEHALHLMFSANRWAKMENVEVLLNQGVDVICDRYAFSGVAYTIAKGFDAHWAKQPDVGLPKPDVVLFFKVSSEVAKTRGGFGEERLENEELQKKVAVEMEKLRRDDYWQVVDASGTFDEVEASVREIYGKLDRSAPLARIEQL